MHKHWFLPLCFCLLAGLPSALRADPADDLFAAGKFDEARQAYAAASKTSGGLAPRLGLIRTLLRLDRWEEAGTESLAATTQFPKDADAHGLRALALIRAGWQPPYADEARRALALDPGNYWGLVASGRAADWDGHPAEARAAFRRAAAARPDLPEAWLGLLQTLSSENDAKEKQAATAGYLKLNPQGQPHDRQIERLRDFLANADAYRRGFAGDPAFQQVGADGKTTGAKPAAGAAQLKIEFVGDYAVFPVTINDKKFRLLFDTGAGDLLLTQSAARRLNLPTIAQSFLRGVSGRERTSVLKADKMGLGALTYRSIPIATLNFSPSATDGILGGSTLDDCVITLDYTSASATLGPAAAAPAPLPGDHTLTLPFRLYREHLFIPVQLNSVPVWAMLDTGAEQSFFPLRLATLQLKAVPKEDYRTGFYSERSGIGDTNRRVSYIYSRDQSTVTLSQEPPLSISADTLGQSILDKEVSPEYDFEIGMLLGVSSFTYAQRVTFDYPHRLLTFEYRDPDATTPKKKSGK